MLVSWYNNNNNNNKIIIIIPGRCLCLYNEMSLCQWLKTPSSICWHFTRANTRHKTLLVYTINQYVQVQCVEKLHKCFRMYKSASNLVRITNPVWTVRRSTFIIGRHGSGFPSRLSLAVQNKTKYISFSSFADTRSVCVLQREQKKTLTRNNWVSILRPLDHQSDTLTITQKCHTKQKSKKQCWRHRHIILTETKIRDKDIQKTRTSYNIWWLQFY